MRRPADKIKRLEELEGLIAEARRGGRTVALCNGCFDLIHVGHIRYLEGARKLADMLVVALNGDDSVRGLKGAGRPLQGERERAEIIAAMECVDYVLVFDDPTVDRILLRLKPDIHAKGTDYTSESVPERDTVLSYGGRVAIAGDPKDHATRDMIETILSKQRP